MLPCRRCRGLCCWHVLDAIVKARFDHVEPPFLQCACLAVSVRLSGLSACLADRAPPGPPPRTTRPCLSRSLGRRCCEAWAGRRAPGWARSGSTWTPCSTCVGQIGSAWGRSRRRSSSTGRSPRSKVGAQNLCYLSRDNGGREDGGGMLLSTPALSLINCLGNKVVEGSSTPINWGRHMLGTLPDALTARIKCGTHDHGWRPVTQPIPHSRI